MHALPMTNDSGFFYTPDGIAAAECAHRTPSNGLNSRNVKRPRNGRKAAKLGVGVTGGYMLGADGSEDTAAARQRIDFLRAKRASKKAAKRDALVAELRMRGYNVR
jgi:hypothetical protein